MGGTSKTSQTQSQQLAPYDPAAPALTGILGQISKIAPSAGTLDPATGGALDAMSANGAKATSAFGAPATAGTVGLLNGGGAQANDNGISSNLAGYRGMLADTASGKDMGANSALRAQLDQITRDTTDQVNSSWAAAGRDGSPGNAQALGRGIASGVAPVIANQYNVDASRKDAAAANLYGAGNTTYGMLNGTQSAANQNFVNGVGTAGKALDVNNLGANSELQAAAQRFGIPVSQLTTLLGAVSPVAAAFGQQNGQSQGTQEMSGAQQFGLIANGIGSLMPKGPISFGK